MRKDPKAEGPTGEMVAVLLELQELEIVLQESRIVHRQSAPQAVPEIEAKVAALRQRVPSASLKRYDMLRRTGLGVAREAGGVCRACRLSVPLGDRTRMRNGKAPWVCPNCGRFLLLEPR